MSTKVLVFAVDAIEMRLVLDWIEEGSLPALAALKERGAWGSVTNPRRMIHSALWSNFYTGVGPKRHGQYMRTWFDPARYSFSADHPDSDRVEPFWLRDGLRAKRCAIINVPNAPLDENINGLQVVHWGMHDFHHKTIRTSPPELADKISSQFGGDPVGIVDVIDRTAKEFRDFRDRLVQRLRGKSEMARHYLASDDWDLFIITLDETHSVGHQCWHVHDPAHPLHDRQLASEVGDPIKDVYIEVDRALGEIMEQVDDTTTVLFVTDLGMGPAEDTTLVLDEILRRIEGQSVGSGPKAVALLKSAWNALPNWMQAIARPLRWRFGPQMYDKLHTNERSQRRCFWLPTQDPGGGIRINLAGREADGLVQPGEEFESYCAHLIDELNQLVDGGSGQKMVSEILWTRDLDLEGLDGDMPDLIVRWAVASPTSIESPTVGSVAPAYSSRKGDHPISMTGVFLATGPSVHPGALDGPVQLEDFAPTIAGLLGETLQETDGVPIAAVLNRNAA